MIKKSIFTVLAILIFLLAACSAPPEEDINASQTPYEPSSTEYTAVNTSQPSPSHAPSPSAQIIEPQAKYIFFLIGDGMGEAHKQLSEEYLRYISGNNSLKLSLNSMDVNTTVTTGSANAEITDSAAAATALATGVKTNNGMISQDPDGQSLTTLLEAVRDKGYATGIVTTTGVTHATPACFYAHNDYRSHEADIALQLLESNLDFIAGGGLSFFLPAQIPDSMLALGPDARGMEIFTERTDGQNLIESFAEKGYKMFIGPGGVNEFIGYVPKAGDKVFAPLTYNYFPYEIDRLAQGTDLPGICDITKQALRLLCLDEEGFFLMVEGGRIDYAAHNNDAFGVIYDTLAFDNVVKVALDFYEAHPYETLIITTSDHETGGLSLQDVDFKSVEEVSASYGDGFATLYDSLKSFDEFIAGVNSLGFYPDEDERDVLSEVYAQTLLTEYSEDTIDTSIALELNDILNKRIGVVWSTDYHTSTEVSLGVTGVFSERFADAQDNTDIANILAEIIGVSIGLQH